jgi:micrococcal nuclease
MQRFAAVGSDCAPAAIPEVYPLLLALLLGCSVTDKDTAQSQEAADTAATDTGSTAHDPFADIDPDLLDQGASPCRSPTFVSVDEVVDGDTIRVTSGRGVERVRLIGIDASEVDHDGDWDDCWAEEAKAYVTTLIEQRSVWLSFDAECEDNYGRTLAYVHTRPGDEGFLQRALLTDGWVSTFAVSPNTTFETLFGNDESEARSADRGLWGACSR